MAHTSEQRDRLSTPLCGATKRRGGKCRAFAGQGTDHPGVGRCKYHGGATPNHKKHAVAIEARRRMVALGAPLPDVHPHQVLLGMLRAGAGHVAWLHGEVGKLEDLAAHESEVMVRLYDEERDRLTRIASACLAAGVSDLEVELSIKTADAIVAPIQAAFDVIGGITVEQKRDFAQALRLELGAAAQSADEARRNGPGAIYRPPQSTRAPAA